MFPGKNFRLYQCQSYVCCKQRSPTHATGPYLIRLHALHGQNASGVSHMSQQRVPRPRGQCLKPLHLPSLVKAVRVRHLPPDEKLVQVLVCTVPAKSVGLACHSEWRHLAEVVVGGQATYPVAVEGVVSVAGVLRKSHTNKTTPAGVPCLATSRLQKNRGRWMDLHLDCKHCVGQQVLHNCRSIIEPHTWWSKGLNTRDICVVR